MDTLKSTAHNLKQQVGIYNSDLFTSRIVSLIHGLTHPWNQSLLKGLVSPLRQLLYLLNLNLTSPILGNYKEEFLEDKDWPQLVTLVKEMEEAHKKEFGELKPFTDELKDKFSEEEIHRRRLVGLSTYNAFFHQGPLNFEEQGIEKIVEVFKNFNGDLKSKFGWDSSDLIAVYDCLDNQRQAKEDIALMKPTKSEPTKEEFSANIMNALKGGASFEQAMMSAVPFDHGRFEYISNPSNVNTFTRQDLEGFSEVVVNILLNNFTTRRAQDDNFLFFSQQNQILRQPIYQLGNSDYVIIDFRLLLSAFFSFIQQKCLEIIKDHSRVYKAKDKFLERKVVELFTNFYQTDKKARIIPSYYVDGSERDLLVLSGQTALVIESKAGKFREPLFDPDKAYSKIWADFKDTIDYGYTQAYTVKEKFLKKQPFNLTNKNGEVMETIDASQYKNVFCIIVTYNKLGHAQNDLWLMLDLYDEDDEYPYATCVDDLEVFLLAMQKKKFALNDFHDFLRKRAQLHENLIVNDEGRVTGHFLNKKSFTPVNGIYKFSLEDDLIYDKLYGTGLGFKNERLMEIKRNPRIKKLT
jgi:hypothetical protein